MGVAVKSRFLRLARNRLRRVMLGRGLPMVFNGEPVVGIGIGGATGGHLDEACAAEGLKAINAG